jgi:integrase
MSTAAELEREQARPFFAPQVARHDSILEAMRAVSDCYGYHVRDFFDFAEHNGGVSFEIVKPYYQDLNGRRYANSTKRLMRQAVKARLRATLDGAMDFNAAAAFREALAKLDRQVKAPKVQTAPIGQDKVIRRDEYERLIIAASYRDKLLLSFLWTTGCRVSELTGARPFSRVYVSTRIHKLALAVLGRGLGAHSLRHSFATRQIRRANKVQAVRAYFGHSSTAITMNYYVHERLDDDELFDPEDGE